MDSLAGAHNFVIHDSQFIEQQGNGVPNGIDILREASNPDAAYDSSARDPPPKCFPGTRKQYVKDTVDWAVPAVGADDPLPLFWMKGPAGVGKSAVAQTCAEKLKDIGRLGAAFFFAVKTRDKAEQFFPTIIYQLSSQFSDYHDLVDHRIRHDRTILNKIMATQFRALLVEPLQELEMMGKGIRKRTTIFIDGLDECEDPDAHCSRQGHSVCWAFFTRPEPHIEGTFTTSDIAQITCTSLLPISHDADGDVELYLRGGFANVLRRRNISLKSQWPSDDDIRTLVRAAKGLFIYVATALRVVAQPGSLLEESLDAILATTPNLISEPTVHGSPPSPFAELDAFYMLIMQRISPKILPTVLLFLRILSLSSSGIHTIGRSVTFVSNILGLSELRFMAMCNQLSAVIHFQDQIGSPPTHTTDTSRPFQYANRGVVLELRRFIDRQLGGSVSFYHKSFHDFLIDSTRSGSFCIASLDMYDVFFMRYQESYCFQGSELILAPGIPDSASSLSYPDTNELINSIIKAQILVYAHAMIGTLPDLSGMDSRWVQQSQYGDFRKHLHIHATLCPPNGELFSLLVRGYRGMAKYISSIRLFQSRAPRSPLLEFGKAIKQLQQAGVMQAYDPDPVSSFARSFPPQSQDQLIFALYRMGHESKSIFWYWEFDSEHKIYREFRAIDLVEGGRVFREQQFDLWPLDEGNDDGRPRT
ncbi:hypothetical protein P691DRAFT_788958 [Macrolepiota fuliginosa MF-IS2]|uniref:Nephrocystin 3-like N-terminal domain-containing protein n=1 Tax=Macrolepiota fuliginosa MF-IS2 TaxID=1400762 RepID=A0A9P5X3P2_9AGAR|nr:hypothetical protein P691DRAFT_788958 [Macrolepiota fuliginosa MF-IS2]